MTTSVAGDLTILPLPDVCEAWGIRPLPEDLRLPFDSDVPVLMVSGDIDLKTPIADADQIARDLGNAMQIKIANMGHQLLVAYEGSNAVRTAVLDFMNDKPVDVTNHTVPFKFENVD